MKICVTGSDGFIASHVVEYLHMRGHKVIGIQRHSNVLSRHPNNAQADIVYLGDVRDRNLVEKVVSMSDGVISLAGILGTKETINNPYPSIEVNIVGTLNVLEACKIWKIPMVYIAVGNHFMNNSYSITKTTGERFCLMYAKEFGVKVNVVRALNAYGNRQFAYPVKKIIPTFILNALAGNDIPVYGDGTQKMDMIYVKDVAKILIDSLFNKSMKNNIGNIFEAGTGIGRGVKDIAQDIINLCESESQIEYLPMRAGETENSEVIAKNPYCNITTSWEVSLFTTIQFYRNNYMDYAEPAMIDKILQKIKEKKDNNEKNI